MNESELVSLFQSCKSNEEKYEKIIELGRSLPPFPQEEKKEENLVKGCQSEMYLFTQVHDGKMKFFIYSEALISAGLGALLLSAYNEQPPETLFTKPPLFLKEIGIPSLLSPSRSNGLLSLYNRMREEAKKFLVFT